MRYEHGEILHGLWVVSDEVSAQQHRLMVREETVEVHEHLERHDEHRVVCLRRDETGERGNHGAHGASGLRGRRGSEMVVRDARGQGEKVVPPRNWKTVVRSAPLTSVDP